MEVSTTLEKVDDDSASEKYGSHGISDEDEQSHITSSSILDKSYTEDFLDQLLQETMANSDDIIDEDSDVDEVEEININNKDENHIESSNNSAKLNIEEKENSPQMLNKPTRGKRVRTRSTENVVSKRKKKDFQPPKLKETGRDIFCWRCHKFGEDVIPCKLCPRVFHVKCSHLEERPSEWICTECDAIESAEKDFSRNPVTIGLTKDKLKNLLNFVIKRMRHHEGSCHFENLVDPQQYPDYKDYIVNPMYLKLLEANVEKSHYNNCEAFLSDAKWMVHNSYIFNTAHSELTLYARAMIKHAKHECEEILNCPNCYFHANTLDDDEWFIEPCDIPHILVWARLKGWPFWPCKVMKISGNNVDVRFFGDHNKSVVPVEQCYLFSKQMPSKQKKFPDLDLAIKESCEHIEKLEEKFGEFRYAPIKTALNPKDELQQRKLLLPHFHEGMTPEEASEIRNKVQKKDCKITIVMSGLMQRSMGRNNNPAVIVATNNKQMENRQGAEITDPMDKTNSQQLHPILTERLLHKKSPQPSTSTILIEDDDSNETCPDTSNGIENEIDNSSLNRSVNELPTLSKIAYSNINKTCSKGHFLSQFNLTRNPQSSAGTNMKSPLGKKTYSNIVVLPSREQQNTLEIPREKKTVYFPLKVASNVSNIQAQKDLFKANRNNRVNNTPQVLASESLSHHFKRKSDPEQPSSPSSLNLIRILSKNRPQSNDPECDSNQHSPINIVKQTRDEKKIVEMKRRSPENKKNDLEALAKKCVEQSYRPMVVIKKLNEDFIVKHQGFIAPPHEKQIKDVSKSSNENTYNYSRLDEDISDLLPKSQIDINEEDDDLSDRNLAAHSSLPESLIIKSEKCSSPVTEIQSSEEIIPLLIKAHSMTSENIETVGSEETSVTTIANSLSKSNSGNSREDSSMVKMPFSKPDAIHSNVEKILLKFPASHSKNVPSSLKISLKKQSPLIYSPQKQQILLQANNLPKIVTSSLNQNHIGSHSKINTSKTHESTLLTRETINNGNCSNLYNDNSFRFTYKNNTLLGKRSVSFEDEKTNIDQTQHLKKKHLVLKCKKSLDLDKNNFQEHLLGSSGSIGSNIQTDNECLPSDKLKILDKRNSKSSFLFFRNNLISGQDNEPKDGSVEELSDTENELSVSVQFDSMDFEDGEETMNEDIEETTNNCSETEVTSSVLFGCKVGRVKCPNMIPSIHLEEVKETSYLLKGNKPHILSLNPFNNNAFIRGSQELKKNLQSALYQKNRCTDWILNSWLPEENIDVFGEYKDKDNEKEILNSNISSNTDKGNINLHSNVGYEADITDLNVNKNSPGENEISTDGANKEKCYSSALHENKLDGLLIDNLTECENRTVLRKKTIPQPFGSDKKHELSSLNCLPHHISRELNLDDSTKSSNKLLENVSEGDIKFTEGPNLCPNNCTESESQISRKEKHRPESCDSVLAELEREDIHVERVCDLELSPREANESGAVSCNAPSRNEVLKEVVKGSLVSPSTGKENELKGPEISFERSENKVSSLRLDGCKSQIKKKCPSDSLEDNEQGTESYADSFSDESEVNSENSGVKMPPEMVVGDNISKSINRISPTIMENNEVQLILSCKKNAANCQKNSPSKVVKENSGPGSMSLISKNLQKDDISLQVTDVQQCHNIPSEVRSLEPENNSSKNDLIASINKVQEGQNKYSSYLLKRKIDAINAKKQQNNPIGGKLSINMENYTMFFQELGECIEAIEKVIPNSEDIDFLRRKFNEVERKVLRKIENDKRDYIEEIDTVFTLEKEMWKQDSRNLCSDEMNMMIEEIKKKQWCILCLNEAKFHCCWSTSYCSEKCQLADWPTHSKACTQYKMQPGDPDLRLSPLFKDIMKRMKHKKLAMKDLVENDDLLEMGNENYSTTSENSSNDRSNSPLTTSEGQSRSSSSNWNSANSFSSSDNQVKSTESLTNAGVSTTKISGKTFIHVPKEKSMPHARVQVTKKSPESDCLSKSIMVKLNQPKSNPGQTVVSIGQGIPPRSLNKFTIAGNSTPHMVLMGKNKYLFPKSLSSTGRIIGTPVSKTSASQEHSEDVPHQGNVIITLPKSSSSLHIGSKTLNIPASKDKAFLVIENNSKPSVKYTTKAPESSQISVPSSSSNIPRHGL